MRSSTTCKDCGITVLDGAHPKAFKPIHNLDLDLDRLAYLKCSSCGSKVALDTVKDQGVSNWRIIPITQALFCPSCSHAITKSFELDA